MMKELNELVELAKKADREVTWSLLPFDLAKEGWCVEVVDYIAAMMPNDILAIAEAFRALEQRAEAAEAKLAELEKQEPVAYIMGDETIDDFKSGYEFFAVRDAEHEEEMESIPLFTRPAPAVSLAELVPDEFTNDEVPCAMTDVIQAEMDGWNACRAEILRNIEEAK